LWKRCGTITRFWEIFFSELPYLNVIGSIRLPKIIGFLNISTFLSNLYPNLANSSCRWLWVWLHHKIGKKKNY
jgi:hypothetical protein